MRWLSSINSVWLLVLMFGFAIGAAVLAALMIRRLNIDKAAPVAAAYMTALGSLFAIFTGFLINSEYGTLRETQRLVGSEVAAASQLAFNTQGLSAPQVELVIDDLDAYLRRVDESEWRVLGAGGGTEVSAFNELKQLQGRVRQVGLQPETPTLAADAMQQAVDQLAAIRRQRVAISAESLPLALFGISALAGIALIFNAMVVALRSGHKYSLIAWGIVAVVALDLAAILAIGAPFRGAFQADRVPIRDLSAELSEGRYQSWVDDPRPQRTCTRRQDATERPDDCLFIGNGESITLGVLAWLGDDSGGLGQDSLDGVNLAIDYLDGQFDQVPGELLGHRVSLAVDNEGCSAEGGLSGAKRLLAEQRLLGVVGTTCSSAALDAADVTLSDKSVLLVSSSNTAPSLTDPDRHQRFYFRTAPNDVVQGAVVADYTRQILGADTAATVSDGSAYSDSLTNVFRQRFTQQGGQAAAQLSAAGGAGVVDPPGGTEMLSPSQIADQLEAAPPSAVFMALFEPTCHEVVTQIRSRPALQDLSIQTSDACQSSEFLAAAGAAGDGVLASGPDLSDIKNNTFYSQQFLPALQRSTGRAPTSVFHASAYDATNLLFGALRRAATRVPGGSLVVDRADLRAAMLDVEGYPGLSGSLTCDPGGDCSQISRIAIYKAPAWPSAEGSQAVPVYSSARSQAEVKLGE
jgi:branched-chain amino acid transport system substrate-binding protein